MNFQYTVLQAALILTITIPLYVSPPDLSTDSNLRAFSFFIGISACIILNTPQFISFILNIGLSASLHLYTIIGITIMSALFNRPYTEADTVLVRIENNFLLVLATICNYISGI